MQDAGTPPQLCLKLPNDGEYRDASIAGANTILFKYMGTDTSSKFSSDVIKINFSSPGVPTVILMDLPGIILNDPDSFGILKTVLSKEKKPLTMNFCISATCSGTGDTLAFENMLKICPSGSVFPEGTLIVINKIDLAADHYHAEYGRKGLYNRELSPPFKWRMVGLCNLDTEKPAFIQDKRTKNEREHDWKNERRKKDELSTEGADEGDQGQATFYSKQPHSARNRSQTFGQK
eukprot:scaffold402007_cov55-Attheya_sp.AAC.3